MLRWEGKGLGLVNIQGQELTALIASNPAPGQILHFLVEKLYPEVVLRELHGIPGLSPSPAMLLADFRTARLNADEALKSIEADLAAKKESGTTERKTYFHRGAARRPETLLALLKLLAAVSELNTYLKPAHDALLSSPNWLMPGASSRELVEFLPKPDRLDESRFFFYLPDLGRCEMRLILKSGKGGLRLFCEEKAHAKAAAKLLANTSPILTRFEFIGLYPLPPESKAGILARLLSIDLGAPFSFDRRV